MEQTLFKSTPKAHIAPYPGGASELLNRFVGDPCVVSTVTSPHWLESLRAGKPTVHSLMCIPGSDAPVVFLEQRRGNCFLYVIVDPTDPALWPVFDKWKESGCFVAHMTIDSLADVGGCPLNDENFGIIGQYRYTAPTPNPEAFAEFVERILFHKALEKQATQKLRQSGAGEDVVPVVEVNILTSVALGCPLSLTGMAPVNSRLTEAGSHESELGSVAGHGVGVDESSDVLDVRLLQFGTLQDAKFFAPVSKSAARMKPTTPVLTSTIDFERYTRYSTIRGVFGFGHFKVDDRIIISFRLQMGAVQVYWLADATDPDVWQAIKRWKAAGEAGFVLADENDSVFIPWKLQSEQRRIGEFSDEAGKKKGTEFIDVVSRLVESGDVHIGATSDIKGVALEYVHVNVLMTKRLEQAADVVVPAMPASRGRGVSKRSVFDGRRGSTLH